MMIEDVRPEGCICELCSDISPNREDIRTKFGYTMLSTHCGIEKRVINAEKTEPSYLRAPFNLSIIFAKEN